MTEKPWMLYGASGYTGTMIAERAVALGHRPILGGRSPVALEALATRLGVPYRVIDLGDRDATAAGLRDVSLVCNAAGPFENTSGPLMQAALKERCHYVDIANEIPVFQMAQAADAAAQAAGIALIPGVGFGVTVSNCLTRFVSSLMPDAVNLDCASVAYVAHRGAGVLKTAIGLIIQGGVVRRLGQLTSWPLGTGAIQIAFPDGDRTLTPIPTGDLEAAYWMTGIPNVTIYSADLPVTPVARIGFAIARQGLKRPGIRRFVERRIERKTQNVTLLPETTNQHSYGWARASNAAGETVEAWLQLGEGYAATAALAVRAVERLVASDLKGAFTPAAAFGADFILEIGEVERWITQPESADDPHSHVRLTFRSQMPVGRDG